MEWMYDIMLNDKVVGTSGDLTFETYGDALADAHDYILSILEKEYEAKAYEFKVNVYEGRVQ